MPYFAAFCNELVLRIDHNKSGDLFVIFPFCEFLLGSYGTVLPYARLRYQPNVKEKASTPGSKNSISKVASLMGPF